MEAFFAGREFALAVSSEFHLVLFAIGRTPALEVIMSFNLIGNCGRPPMRQFATQIAGLIFFAFLWSGAVLAQSTRYTYDANGRVVAITANNGTSAQYSYDALGDLSSVGAPIPASQLAIFAFMPTHGQAGVQVTIQGQGFDSTAANDAVSFNGVTATVLSATSTQLITTVPSGATTGAISVTVAGKTAISAAPFVIDGTGEPPTITQVSPLVVAIGGMITVNGANLAPVVGDTTVQMAGVDMLTGLSQTDTQVRYTVPSNAVSGHVKVNTPYGSATSNAPVAVLPSSVANAVNGAPSSYVTANGSPVNFSTAAAGGSGVLTFDAPQGGNYEFALSGITISGSNATEITVQIYGPLGGLVTSSNCFTTSPGATCRIAAWNLGPGTYAAVVSPVDTSSLLSFNAIVEPDATGPTLTVDTPTTVSLTTGGVERLTFSANAGDNVALQLSGVSTVPAAQGMQVYVYSPSLAVITTSNYYASFTSSGSNTINLTNLPVSGVYTVVISTSGIPAIGQLTLATSTTTAIASGAGSLSYGTSVASQNAYFSFAANRGDNLELTIAIQSLNGISGISVNVYNAAGVNIGMVDIYASDPASSRRISLWNLAAGNYAVIVSPLGNGTMSFSALLQPDVIAGALTANSPAAVNLGWGQMERFTFTANAGDNVALNLSNVSTIPAGQTLYAHVNSPNSQPITSSDYYTYFSATSSSSTTINLSNLPATGTYTVTAYTVSGSPATAQLTLVPEYAGTLTSGGAALSYSTTVAGQNAHLSFTANAGDNLELTFVIQGLNGMSGISVNAYNAAGVNVGTVDIYASDPASSRRIALWNLAAGTYSVIVSPLGNGTMSFNALLQPDVIAGALTANSPVAVNLGWGQMERFTFTANAGDNVALNLSNVSTNPAGQTLYAHVNSPDSQPITSSNYYTYFGASNSTTTNLTNLPSTGTYTVIFYTVSGSPATAQLTLVPQ